MGTKYKENKVTENVFYQLKDNKFSLSRRLFIHLYFHFNDLVLLCRYSYVYRIAEL